MKEIKEYTIDYDVSGGDENFEAIPFTGDKDLALQFFYTSLDEADHKIRLQESLNGVNFLDSVDSSGSTIEIIIDNTLDNDILKVSDFNTGFIRFQFIEGTTGTGTIDSFKILME